MNRSKLNPITGGLNPVRRLLLESVKTQTGYSLTSDATKYFDLVDRLVRTRGKADTIKRLKQIHHTLLNFMLDQPTPVYPIRVHQGVPFCVNYLRKYKTSPEAIQAALSLTNYYRGMVSPGQPNFDPITDPSSVDPSEIINLITRTEPPISWRFDPNDLQSLNHLYKTKKGPNGLATLSAFRDLDALSRTNNLIEDIRYFDKVQNDGKEPVGVIPQEILDFYKDNPDLAPLPTEEPKELSSSMDFGLSNVIVNHNNRHSRLAIKHEGGGKDRIFAMADYYTQCALDPLHNKLAKILRTINQDCTFNQSKGVEDIKSWTMKSDDLHSLDLSSATDRFPRELQMKLLSKLTDSNEYGYRWADLMANREFHYKGNTYKWAVGQPLGALSSWPMFALTHHYVVRYCAHVTKSPLQYYLLGDDIVIKGNILANKYVEVMTLLGVKISLTKSLDGKSAEFAKRIFTRGVEISPAPMQMIKSLLSDPTLVKATFDHLTTRSSRKESQIYRSVDFLDVTSKLTRLSIESLSMLAYSPVPLRNRKTEITTICSIADGGKSMWSQINNLTLYQVQFIYMISSYNMMRTQLDDMNKETQLEVAALDHMEIPGLTPGVAMNDYFPMKQGLYRRNEQILKSLGEMVKIEQERKFFFDAATEVLIPNLKVLSFRINPKSKKSVRLEKLIIAKVFKVCKDLNVLIENRTLAPLDTISLYSIMEKNDILPNKF